MKDLSNKNVLITGAGNGIGKLLSIAMAKEGSNIVLWDLNPKSIGMVAKEIGEMGKKAWVYPCDVSKKEEVYKQAEKVQKEVGKIDVLINNAGIVSGKPFLECSDEELERSIDVNLLAHFWTTKAFLPDMIKTNSGHLVSIASAAGLIGIASLADYSASKFAVVGFDESIRMELRKSKINGVKTTCVCPYYINTGMFDGVKTKSTPSS